ncbi:MAG TPA: LysR family transcriptional regulator [Paenirhodobacter sp.]
MKHLKVLEYFIEVARAGSIRKAADRVYLTASALNRRIQDLEDELGVTLFERWARGVRLTPSGEILLRYADQSLRAAAEIAAQFRALDGHAQGSVRMICSQALAAHFLPSCINEFQQHHPRVNITADVADHRQAIAALRNHDAEFALIFNPTLDPSIHVIASISQRLVALLRPGHPLAHKDKLSLEDCLAYPVALPGPELGTRQLIDQLAAREGYAMNVIAQSNSFEMLQGIVATSDAISFQIEVGAPPQRYGMRSVAVPLNDRRLRHDDLVLCCLADSNLGPAADAFAHHIATRLGVLGGPTAGNSVDYRIPPPCGSTVRDARLQSQRTDPDE